MNAKATIRQKENESDALRRRRKQTRPEVFSSLNPDGGKVLAEDGNVLPGLLEHISLDKNFAQVPTHTQSVPPHEGIDPGVPRFAQARLSIGAAGDQFEKEADRMADQVVNRSRTRDAVVGGQSSPPAAPAGGRTGATSARGQPLDPDTRRLMEAHLHHDFSRVRVHTDTRAAESARAMSAVAYTVGHNVTFAAHQYQPTTLAGRHLLAHELAHVVQQSQGQSTGQVQRRGILETLGIFFGLTEGTFSDKELKDYLEAVTKNNKIEDSFDSDNKARAVVRKWMGSEADFNLTANQKVLMIQEMDSGWVGGEDQKGILDLLQHSDNIDLRVILASGGVKPQTLLADFGGRELQSLKTFFNARFKGGEAALIAGTVDPQGAAAVGAPKFPYSWPILKAKIESGASTTELLENLASFTLDERNSAVKDLALERVNTNRQLDDLKDQFRKEPDATKKALVKDKAKAVKAYVEKMEAILLTVSKDIAVGETSASLSSKTKVLSAADRTAAREALKPELKKDVAGVVLPFQSTLVGETKTYEEKLRDFIPGMINNYFSAMVTGREAPEHSDPTKVHPLKELEDIGNVSKKETDDVFGAYYSAAAHPALKADTTTTRGNIHDLWADTEADLAAMTRDQRRDLALALMFYFFQSDDGVLTLNHDHNADPKRSPAGAPLNPEATSLDTLAKEFTTTDAQIKKLNEIDRGWDASAGGGQINIQIFKKPTSDEDRDFLWDMFQTLIHEYIHTLVHSKYETYALSFGREKTLEFNTLIEGMDSYLDEVVWANIQPRVNDPGLREKIEGPVDSKKPPINVLPASRRRYASYAQAVKLVNIVGPQNIYAAYFLGETDKIGA